MTLDGNISSPAQAGAQTIAQDHSGPCPSAGNEVRNDWTREEIAALFDLPFDDLVFQAATVHRANHKAGQVQLSTLLSIKTGGCPEDCGYCNQSAGAKSGLKAEKLLDVRTVLQTAAQAKDRGSSRFCMGAAWRNPKNKDMPAIIEMIKGVRQMGMETCMTLGMLTKEQSEMLSEAGLDYYNHNIDTSPEHYEKVITTRTFGRSRALCWATCSPTRRWRRLTISNLFARSRWHGLRCPHRWYACPPGARA